MAETATFADPPIVELILGVQFAPLVRMTTGHFGLFWNELGEHWNKASDAPIHDDHFEVFDRPSWSLPNRLQFRIGPVQLPNRIIIEHQGKDRLIQLQATRFHLNWQKGDDSYPRYKKLVCEFEDHFRMLEEFLARHELGPLLLNQWELTYINSFAHETFWQTPADWTDFLPGLFGKLFPTESLDIGLEQRAAAWSYEIKPKRGRLHISANTGRWGEDSKNSLLLELTARGPIGKDGVQSFREGINLGHEVAIETFQRLLNEQLLQQWGTKS